MKIKLIRLTTAVLFISILVPAFAAKGDRKKQNAENEAYTAILKKYDVNANGKIDGDETVELRKAFSEGKDETLKALDKNADGKLSDDEIAAVAPSTKAKKKK